VKGKSVALLIIAVGAGRRRCSALSASPRQARRAQRFTCPKYQRPPEVVRLEQKLDGRPAQNASITRRRAPAWCPTIGSRRWKQPCLSLSPCGMFTDPAYLDRFGFIPSEADPELKP